MKNLLMTLLLCGLYFQGFGQVEEEFQLEHELKVRLYNLFLKNYHGTYEFIIAKEKLGIEIGAGIDINPASLRSTSWDPSMLNFDRDDFKSRKFNSSIAIKYYVLKGKKSIDSRFFVGPFAELDRVIFYEDAFFQRQEELVMENEFYTPNFIGERMLNIGVKGGFKIIHRSNFLLEFNAKSGIVFEERIPGELEFDSSFFGLHPEFKIGYVFRGKSKEKLVK